jgi:hypothetical protein
VDRYLSEMEIPIQMHPGSQPDVFTLSFHRPLSTYFKLLGDNGLVVNILEEWTSHRKNLPGRNQKAENLSREEIPMFLCLGAVKCN